MRGSTRFPLDTQGRRHRRSRGVVLPSSLLVLVVLTLLGTAAVFSASTDADIAGNGRSDLHALSSAEAGVHEAFARVNMKTGAAPARIVPQVDGGGNPVASWERRIVNASTLGANDLQTLTGAVGSSSALPVTTIVRYKTEAEEQPVSHCDADGCTGEVVRFHTDFGYGGTNVATASQVGPPVIRVQSTYTSPANGARTITVDAVRTMTLATVPGALRTCGPVSCSSSTKAYVDGSEAPGDVGIVSPSSTCNGTNAGGTVSTQACPSPASGLFQETFGMSPEELKSLADLTPTAPYIPPNGLSGKIVYVTGSTPTDWASNMTIGSATDPVIVIFEGDFGASGTITVWGMIYTMGNLTSTGNMKVNGAIIAQGTGAVELTGSGCTGGGSPTSCASRYDPNVLGKLTQFSPFTTILWSSN